MVVNGAPVITTSPVTQAVENLPYTYDVDATDTEGETLTFSLVAAPTGMTIDPLTGLIQWTPDISQLGGNPVTVRVQDTAGLFDTQSFTVDVAKVVSPPQIDPINDQQMDEGATLTVDVAATDPDGDPLTLTVTGLHAFGNFTDNGDGTGSIALTPGLGDA